jgi:phage protein D
MQTRRALAEIYLNGTNIYEDLSGDLLDVTYTDNAAEEADNIDVTIQNRAKKWLYNWFPQTSDALRAVIKAPNWSGALDCGEFVVDDVSAAGWPLTVSIRGVALPADKEFAEVPRSQTWENATLQEIFSDKCGAADITLEYEAEYNPIIPFISQTETTDQGFMHDLAGKYGLTLKMYSAKAVIYDREEYKNNAAAVSFTQENMLSFSARATITDAGYTGCTVKYTEKDGSLTEYTYSVEGQTPKIYAMAEHVDSPAEAERVAKSRLLELNMGETFFDCAVPGGTFLVSGINIDISGFGNFDGKYMVDKAIHKLGGGYTTSLSMTRILSAEGAAEKEARESQKNKGDMEL